MPSTVYNTFPVHLQKLIVVVVDSTVVQYLFMLLLPVLPLRITAGGVQAA